jgi:hypothetical protein
MGTDKLTDAFHDLFLLLFRHPRKDGEGKDLLRRAFRDGETSITGFRCCVGFLLVKRDGIMKAGGYIPLGKEGLKGIPILRSNDI